MTDEPNWKPLESRLPIGDCANWMWMGRVERGGLTIEQYKHRDTRGYLNLDQQANAWRIRYVNDGCDPWCAERHEHRTDSPPDVDPIPFHDALEWALS